MDNHSEALRKRIQELENKLMSLHHIIKEQVKWDVYIDLVKQKSYKDSLRIAE